VSTTAPRAPGPGAALAAGIGRVLGLGRLRDAGTFGRHLLEAMLLMSLAFALAWWADPADPFGRTEQFPWLWMMPALLALRFGSIVGLFGGAVVALGWFGHLVVTAAPPTPFPQQYFLGGLVLVLGCGQFSDVWHDRHRRVREVNHFLSERLGALTRAHFLLQLSHQRIEHELLVRPVTLRDLLGELRAVTDREPGELPGSRFLMQMLSQSCELEVASLHPVHDGVARPDALARLGEAGTLDGDDPLVRSAFELDRLAHVQADQAAAAASRYLVCVPVDASDRQRVAVLAVERMPFFALNPENLQLLTVLTGYWADGLRARHLVRRVLALRPDCPADFALEVVRLHALKKQSDIDSALVAFVFDRSTEHTNLAGQIRRMPRSLDMIWEIETPTHRVMVNLLALAGPAAIEGFLARIEGVLRGQFDTDFQTARVAVQIAQLNEAEPEWTLDDLLARCRVPARTPSPPTPPAPGAAALAELGESG
jgi:polysaccharide biosynthesis protein PelD